MISTHPPSKRIILCIADDDAILRYEKVLLEKVWIRGLNGGIGTTSTQTCDNV